MITNAACTVYRKLKPIGFERVFIPECFLTESSGAALKKGLARGELSVIVYIPAKYAFLAPTSPLEDMLVLGECAFTFDNSSAQTVSESMRAFGTEYDFATVKTVDRKLYGRRCAHVEVTAI